MSAKLRKLLAANLATTAALSACGGGGISVPPTLAVYVSLGSLQCSGGGTSLSALEAQLLAAGVSVLSSSCGTDGLARLAVCGVPDGRIAIVVIPSAQDTAAAALGFAPLGGLPGASATPCS